MKGRKIDCLNHGFLRLVDWMGNDLSIARNARVSYDAAWRAGENEGSDARLIDYLYKNGHNTPFESVTVTFEVKAPIFVFRQWHRHRTQSYNELSARYRPLPSEFFLPQPTDIGEQSKDNKQMRNIGDMSEETMRQRQAEITAVEELLEAVFDQYETLLAAGWPRELARSILPVGTYSHMFATANLHNWFRFLAERLHPHAQQEIRVYAEAILTILEDIAPVAVAAFKEHTLERKENP